MERRGHGPSSTRFSRGEAITVEVDRIEKELASLWQAASRGEDGSETRPIARAALWNLVIPARGIDSLSRVKRLVDELAPAMPARVITLCRGWGAGRWRGISATIESNVVLAPGRRPAGLRRGDHAHRRRRRGRRASLRRARARAANPELADGDLVVRRLARRQPAQQRAPAGLPTAWSSTPAAARGARELGRRSAARARSTASRSATSAGCASPASACCSRACSTRRWAAGRSRRRATSRSSTAGPRSRARSCWRPGWACSSAGGRSTRRRAPTRGPAIRLRFAAAKGSDGRERTVVVDLRPSPGECGTSGIVVAGARRGRPGRDLPRASHRRQPRRADRADRAAAHGEAGLAQRRRAVRRRARARGARSPAPARAAVRERPGAISVAARGAG